LTRSRRLRSPKALSPRRNERPRVHPRPS
jgi:hypothetical protein